jgi:carbon-monoxide dehydrogenase medium subunit
MKAAPFEHARPASLTEAISLLATRADTTRVLAGGQSLGPMLNLRLAQPRLLVQVDRLPELAGVAADADAVTIGACVTHAAIADGRVPDVGGNVLARVADNIAYRAVRNRGTIGGSLCHADPAADWVTVLSALDAIAVLQGPGGARSVPVTEFVQGAFRTALTPG